GYLGFGSSVNGGAYSDGQMVITTAGNVGIGTTTPNLPLHVYSATGDTLARFESGDPTARIVLTDSVGSAFIENNGTSLNFPSGNVGIGTTNPAVKFEVKDTTTGTTGMYFSNSNSSSGNANARIQIFTGDGSSKYGVLTVKNSSYGNPLVADAFTIGSVAHTGGVAFLSTVGPFKFLNSETSELVRITNTGNVGIGTTGPTAKLQINGVTGDATGIHFLATGWTAKTRIGPVGTDGGQLVLSTNVNSETSAIDDAILGTSKVLLGNKFISFSTGDTNTAPSEKVRINLAGNVGIGTVAPSELLDIQKGNDGGVLSLSRLDSNNLVASGDLLGSLVFKSNTGEATQSIFAKIDGNADGNTGLNDRPSRLSFWTIPDGSATLAERMRIDNNG
ncbi:MAG: hypothetical protein COX77_03445, partial [Candidatus Komeilibacteria bacterium CG_4_10_14_0_2_um_filter_37_10]